MSNRTVQFFALPDEFQSWLSGLSDEQSLRFAMEEDSSNPNRIEEVALDVAMSAKWWRFYITDQSLHFPIVEPDINPHRWGLVACDRPRFEGDVLIMAVMASKSDWADEQRRTHENLHGHQLLGKLRRQLKKITTERTWIRPLGETTNLGSLVADVRCTPRAAQWARAGGTMQQEAGFASEFIVAP